MKIKKVFEPITDTNEDNSRDMSITITETYVKNIKVFENLSNKRLEIMNDRGVLASYLLYLLSKITNPKNTSKFKIVIYHNSNSVNDLLKHKTIPVTPYRILLKFRNTGKDFELHGDLLRMITNKNYNVDLPSLSDIKLLFDFAKEMHFDVKAQSKKFN